MPKRYAHFNITEHSDDGTFAHDVEVTVSFLTKKDRETFKRAVKAALKSIENGDCP